MRLGIEGASESHLVAKELVNTVIDITWIKVKDFLLCNGNVGGCEHSVL